MLESFNPAPAEGQASEEKDYLWLNLRELPYFRGLMRAVEASYYAQLVARCWM
jgi:hypothetical protein